MSKYLTNAAVTEFDAEVKHQYQGMGSLRNAVTVRNNVKAEAYKFARMGRGMAMQKASGADVTPMDVSHARQTAYLANWYAAEYTDIFDQAEVNYDEKSELATTIAKGLKRRTDQIIINTLAGASFASTNDQDPDTALTVDLGAVNFIMSGVHRVVRHFQELEMMGDTEIHAAVTAQAVQNLLQVDKVGSQDYNGIRPLLEGELNVKWMGIIWNTIGVREEGGLPIIDSTNHYGYFWAKDAIGLAVGIDQRTEVNYIPVKTSWLCNGLMKMGAVLREPQGVVRIQYDPTAT